MFPQPGRRSLGSCLVLLRSMSRCEPPARRPRAVMTFLPLARPKRQVRNPRGAATGDDEACATDAHTARCAGRGAHWGHHSTTSVAGVRRGARGRDVWAFCLVTPQPDIREANWGETGGTP